MSDDNIIDFKPSRPPSPEEQQFNSIVRALQDMTPEGRISAIAASCGDDGLVEWWKLLELAVYSIATAYPDRSITADILNAIASPMHSTVDDVIKQAMGTRS